MNITTHYPPMEPSHSKQTLGEFDAVLSAPKWHQILFENKTLRILQSLVQPGDTVPLHTHQWDSLIVTLQNSRFKIENAFGNISEEEPSHREVPFLEFVSGSLEAHAFTNIGSKEFKALVFEFKK